MSVDALKTPLDAGVLYSTFLGRLSGDPLAIRGLIGENASHLETDWHTWLPALLPTYLTDPHTGELVPFGEHHTDFWDWVWALELGVKPPPMVCIWPRGGGKSTSAELAAVMVGALRKRRYVLYICDTIERAEDHVSNVAGMLERPEIERYYPHIARPLVGKTGASKGWRRNRLRTASSFTVDALGMNVAARGVKLDDVRPDLIIIDDIDVESDGPTMTKKKIRTLTTKFFPAGSKDSGALFVQNLIHPESIASRLAGVASESADFLKNRIVSGPFPAVHDLQWEERDNKYVITGGRPIWQGMDLAKCEEYINEWGISAFLSESQQQVEPASGGLFDHLPFDRMRCNRDEVPQLDKVEVWCDPAVTDTDQSDAHGIQVDGLGRDGRIYRLYSWESRSSPDDVLRRAIAKALEYGATAVGVETNQGGGLWRILYENLIEKLKSGEGFVVDGKLVTMKRDELGRPLQALPRYKEEKASSGTGGKPERGSQMLADYERFGIVHVRGTHDVLERALKRAFVTKPFDLADAAYWSWRSLRGGPKKMRVY